MREGRYRSVGKTPTLRLVLSAHEWQVWVDTGGTFTDCIGVAPDGSVRRAKVLSSSRLRGVVVDLIDRTSMRVDARWGGHPGLVEGLTISFRSRQADHRLPRESGDPAVPSNAEDPFLRRSDLLLRTTPDRPAPDPAGDGTAYRILRFDPERGILTVRDPLPRLHRGDIFEIHSPEEAPVLAARIIKFGAQFDF